MDTILNLEDLSRLTLAEKRQFLEEKLLVTAKKDEFDAIVVMMDISGSVTDNNNFAFEAQINEITRLLEDYFTKVRIFFCGWGDCNRFKIFDHSFIDRRIVENYFLIPNSSFRRLDNGVPFHSYTMPSSPIKEGHALLRNKGFTSESRILFIITTDGDTNSRIENGLEHRVTEGLLAELKGTYPLLSIWFVFADMRYKAENAEQMAGDTMLTLARKANSMLPSGSLPLVTRMYIKTTRDEPGIEELCIRSNQQKAGHYSFGMQSFRVADIQLFFSLLADLIHGETQIDTNDHMDLLFKLNDTFREMANHFPLDVLVKYQSLLTKAFEGTETGSGMVKAYFADMNERISEKKIYLKRESIAFCQRFFQSCNEKLSLDGASAVGLSTTKDHFLTFPLDPVVVVYGACCYNEFCDTEPIFPLDVKYKNLAIKAGFNLEEQKPIILPVLPCIVSLQGMDPVQEQCVRQAFRAFASHWLYMRYGYIADYKSDEMIVIALFLNALMRLSTAPDHIKLGWKNMALIMLRKRVFHGNTVSTVLRDLLAGKPFVSSEQQQQHKFAHYMNIVKKLAEIDDSACSAGSVWYMLMEALEIPTLLDTQKAFFFTTGTQEVATKPIRLLRAWAKECSTSQPLQMGIQRASFTLPMLTSSKSSIIELSATKNHAIVTKRYSDKSYQKEESLRNTSLRGRGKERRIIVFLQNDSVELQDAFIVSLVSEFAAFCPVMVGEASHNILGVLNEITANPWRSRLFVVSSGSGVGPNSLQGLKNTFLFSVYYNDCKDFEIINKQINWYLHNRTTYKG